MKRLFILFLLLFASYAYSQNTANIDTLQQQLIEMQKAISTGGDLIESGGLCSNLGLGLTVGGGIVAGVVAIPYATTTNNTNNNYKNLLVGVSIGGAVCLAGIILCIVGNKKISDGGTFLREIKVTGNGVAIPLTGKKQKQPEHLTPEP